MLVRHIDEIKGSPAEVDSGDWFSPVLVGPEKHDDDHSYPPTVASSGTDPGGAARRAYKRVNKAGNGRYSRIYC